MQALITEFNAAAKSGIETISGALTRFVEEAASKVEAALHNPIAASRDDAQYPLDEKLWQSAPTVAVPKYAEFQALKEVGHRFLATAEGLYIEVRRPWLHFIQPIAQLQENSPRPPYGTVGKKVELAFQRLGVVFPLIRQFVEAARAALPNEHAAWIVWNSRTGDLNYREVDAPSTSPNHVDIRRPALEEFESLAFDIHSHGDDPAFFSPTDDGDDAGEVKIACVVGDLGPGKTPSIVFRIGVLGMTMPINVPASAVFGETK
ncbi:PRTRC system protein A [Cupriavidus basilensis]|uniref:PRTRC system protein A n=1 Tax=Cupriavidus basilensis TaxID=68895 RepID=UPI00075076FE|nr:PRTRC system protein A [Cupriavidus basilensis]